MVQVSSIFLLVSVFFWAEAHHLHHTTFFCCQNAVQTHFPELILVQYLSLWQFANHCCQTQQLLDCHFFALVHAGSRNTLPRQPGKIARFKQPQSLSKKLLMAIAEVTVIFSPSYVYMLKNSALSRHQKSLLLCQLTISNSSGTQEKHSEANSIAHHPQLGMGLVKHFVSLDVQLLSEHSNNQRSHSSSFIAWRCHVLLLMSNDAQELG